MAHSWCGDSKFRALTLEVLLRACAFCGLETHVKDYKERRVYLLREPTKVVSQMTLCPNGACPGHHHLMVAEEETLIAPPRWIIGWDVFAQIGHRRFSRHWSVPEIREDLIESHGINLSEDAIEDHIGRYQAILAARQRDPEQMGKAYRSIRSLVLTIDGLQPEKGHEALYTVRELNAKRVWFASPLISASHAEVRKLLEQARAWAERLGKPVQSWISDKQDAFVKEIARVFPGVPHRYCHNHFLRDVAAPVLEVDSHAKVQMRAKVRGLREVEADILKRGKPKKGSPDEAVMKYSSAIRGLLNRNQSGPLDPPGLRMATGLKQVRSSIQRSLDAQGDGQTAKDLRRLAGCIDRGLAVVADALERIPAYVDELRAIYATLDPETGSTKERKQRFQLLSQSLRADGEPIKKKIAEIMDRFERGLFAGGDRLDALRDNLELERWFRLPKSHERRVHGRQHAGTRLVLEGPSMVLALDAHSAHPRPFTETELEPWLGASPTPDELQAIERRKVMRKAASREALPTLLADLEDSLGAEQPTRRKRQSHASSG
jgi:hypothetical protein